MELKLITNRKQYKAFRYIDEYLAMYDLKVSDLVQIKQDNENLKLQLDALKKENESLRFELESKSGIPQGYSLQDLYDEMTTGVKKGGDK